MCNYTKQLIENLKSIQGDNNNIFEYSYWNKRRSELRNRIIKEGPENFLQWNLNENNHQGFSAPQRLQELKAESGWEKFKELLDIGPHGNPFFQEGLDGVHQNMIIQCHRLKTLLDNIEPKKPIRHILEFGCDYGAMCKLIKSLWFKGEYHLYDFPEYSALQQWFLEKNEIDNFFCWSDTKYVPIKIDLFISMFALAEAPPELRTFFLDKIQADYIYIGYCTKFLDEINNDEYFDKYMKEKPNYSWTIIHDSVEPTERLLIGVNSD